MEGERGLGWSWGAPFRADLSPSFAEEIAEVPAGLYC